MINVAVLFRAESYALELAADTAISSAVVLRAALDPKLPDELKTALGKAANPVVIMTGIGGEQFMPHEEVLEQLEDGDKILSSIAVDGKATIKLVEQQPDSAELQVVSASGEYKGAMELKEDATMADVLKSLCSSYMGDMMKATLQFPAKKQGMWLDLKAPGSAVIMSAVELAIRGLLPMLKPPVPTSLTALRVVLPRDAAPLPKQPPVPPQGGAPPAGNTAAATGGGPNPMSKARLPAEDMARVLKALQKPDKTMFEPLMFGNECEPVDAPDGTAVRECFITTLGAGKYSCTLCDRPEEAPPRPFLPPRARSVRECPASHATLARSHTSRRVTRT